MEQQYWKALLCSVDDGLHQEKKTYFGVEFQFHLKFISEKKKGKTLIDSCKIPFAGECSMDCGMRESLLGAAAAPGPCLFLPWLRVVDVGEIAGSVGQE